MELVKQKEFLHQDFLWQLPQNVFSKSGGIFLISGAENTKSESFLVLQAMASVASSHILWARPSVLESELDKLISHIEILNLPTTNSGSISTHAKSEILSKLKAFDCLVLGPGLTGNAQTVQLVWDIFWESKIPVVLIGDAFDHILTGLNIIKKEKGEEELFKKINEKKETVIIVSEFKKIEKLAKILSESAKNNNKTINNVSQKSRFGILSFLDNKITTGTAEKIVETESTNVNLEILGGIFSALFSFNQKEIEKVLASSAFIYKTASELAGQNIKRKLIATDVVQYINKGIKQLTT